MPEKKADKAKLHENSKSLVDYGEFKKKGIDAETVLIKSFWGSFSETILF